MVQQIPGRVIGSFLMENKASEWEGNKMPERITNVGIVFVRLRLARRGHGQEEGMGETCTVRGWE